MSWVSALKEYAQKTGKFAVPKRGSPEYEEVKKIQASMAAAAASGESKPASEKPSKVPELAEKLKRKKIAKAVAEGKTPEQIEAKAQADAEAAKAKAAADAEAAKVAKVARGARKTAENKAAEEAKIKAALDTPAPPKRIRTPKGASMRVVSEPVVNFV